MNIGVKTSSNFGSLRNFTLVPEVFIFFPMREPRSSEHESRSGEKEKPLVTLDLNLTFMQKPGSGSDPRALIG